MTAYPALANASLFKSNSHCSKSCCSSDKSTENHKQPNHNDCCKNGACNPFMICCNCSALVVQIKQMHVPFAYLSKNFNIETQVFTSNFLPDTWHPPKVV